MMNLNLSLLIELKRVMFDQYAKSSYSQEGEDRILDRLIGYKEKGFFVDVGAHHPTRFSNTYLFYKRGWSGINIDAAPGSMKLFHQFRSRDINLELAIAANQRTVEFTIFKEPAINSFDPQIVNTRLKEKSSHIVATKKMQTHRLEKVLEQYLEPNQFIDFFTIDVEGLDLEVLQSNDWQRFRPNYVLVECLNSELEKMSDDKVYQFLQGQNYALVSKTFNTAIFRDRAIY